MKKINNFFCVATALLGAGCLCFYFILHYLLSDALYRMIGISFSGADMNQISVFLHADNQKAFYNIGREYLLDNGYSVSGINHLLENLGLYHVLLIFIVFQFVLLIAIYIFVRRNRCSVLLDCNAVAGYLDRCKENENERPDSLRNKEMEEVCKQIEDLMRVQQHQKEVLVLEKEHLKEFTQNVYHQIKTPLAELKVCLEQMVEERERSRECEKMVDRLSGQVRTLLDIGQFEANIVKLPKRQSDLAILLEDAIYSVGIFARTSDVRITYELPNEALFDFNYFWMREAIENILTNACDQSRQGQEVLVKLSLTQAGYRITIDDEAGGLNNDAVFDRYVTAGGEGHYGIGLHLSKVIIENHFGSVRASKNSKGGTCFEIKLPILRGKIPYE